MLDTLGLVAATSTLCTEFAEIHTGITIHSAVDLDESDVPEELKIVVFRILQESLNNLAKHSKAKNGWVSLTLRDAKLSLTVRDDGIGFDGLTSGEGW